MPIYIVIDVRKHKIRITKKEKNSKQNCYSKIRGKSGLTLCNETLIYWKGLSLFTYSARPSLFVRHEMVAYISGVFQ